VKQRNNYKPYTKESHIKPEPELCLPKEEVPNEESPAFLSILYKTAAQDKKERPLNLRDVEPLAYMDYQNELKIKNEALRKFWKLNELPLNPLEIIPSPKERHYRTTSKRKAVRHTGHISLLFADEDIHHEKNQFSHSELEPKQHNIIYRFLLDKINEPAFKTIGLNLNYIIIRGSYTEFAVIFNVHTLTGAIVNKIKTLGEYLKRLNINVISAFIYLDPTESEYYLEANRPDEQVSYKKVYGPDKLFVKTPGKKYSFSPTAFSQVNESMIPVMLKLISNMALPAKAERFIDLYCGYGLFSHYFADNFKETIGIDAEGASIKSAIDNSVYMSHKYRVRFFPKRITDETLEELLPDNPLMEEFYLLDPPRHGTAEGVIGVIAERKPLKIVHIFCGIERIPAELKEWKKNGYEVKSIQPIDMFPGTPNLEVLILLEPVSEL